MYTTTHQETAMNSYLTDFDHEDSLCISTSTKPTAAQAAECTRSQVEINAAYAAKKAAQAQATSEYEKATKGYHPEAGPEPSCDGGIVLATHADGRVVRDMGNGLLAVDHLGGSTTRLVRD
jgi:hypothetical protein